MNVFIFSLDRRLIDEYSSFARSFTKIRAQDIAEQVENIYAERTSDSGGVLRSPRLSDAAARSLHLETVSTLNGLTGAHRGPLVRHGAKHFLNPTD